MSFHPRGLDLHLALTALRQSGDAYVSEKPPTLLRSKADQRPVIAALIPADRADLRVDDVEVVPGPGR